MADDKQEHSGLHEIKELAKTTKRRISRRVTSQMEVDESLLSSGSTLASMVLPSPGKEQATPLPRLDSATPAPAVTAAEVRRDGTDAAVAERRGLGIWIVGGLAVAAAAAAVALFVVQGGAEPAADAASAAGAPAGSAPAAVGAPVGDTPAPVVAELDDEADEAAADEAAADEAAADEAAVAVEAAADEAAADEAAAADETDVADSSAAAKAAARREAASRAADRQPSADDRAAAERDRAQKAADDRVAAAEAAKAKTAPATDEADDTAAEATTADDSEALDDILAGVTGGVEDDAPARDTAPKTPTKTRLDRSDVATAMAGVRGKAKACYDVEQYTGSVSIKFTVEPSGAISSAKAKGEHASSATGTCVASAVKGATFPAYDGRPTSFTFPFLLSQ